MLVITTREFRANQKNYLDKVDEGIEILVQRGKNKCYKIIPVAEDDTLMSKEEFYAKIERSMQQAKEGKVRSIDNIEDFKQLLEK